MWVASEGVTHRFGIGLTAHEALADLVENVVDYRKTLEANEEYLSSSLQRDLETLREPHNNLSVKLVQED